MGGGGGVPPGGSGAPAHPPHRYSVAPMLECTDRHFRFLARLLTKRTQLWTEMVKDDAIIHAEDKILASSACEQPVVLQLGGHEPERLALATRAAAKARWPYYEVNLNCGCPSERVQTFSFGAVLMLNAKLAGECMAAIGAALPTGAMARHGRVGARRLAHHELSLTRASDACVPAAPRVNRQTAIWHTQ